MSHKTYYVETYRPPYTPAGSGLAYRVHETGDYSTDSLSPNMTAVFEVTHVRSKREAVAAVIEYAAGFRTTCRLIRGGGKAQAS